MRKCLLAMGGAILMSVAGAVQGVTQGGVQALGLPVVPTTKVLAIGHMTAPAPAAVRPVMPSEVRETVKLYLAGKIDQWYVRKDTNGVVFLMNVTTVEEAHAVLEALPLGVAKLMEFELIPIGPLSPLAMLVGPPPAAGATSGPAAGK